MHLVVNARSGSNTGDAIDNVRKQLADAGWAIPRLACFPDDDLPSPEQLDAEGVDTCAVFAGDGTINALVNTLAGWGGQVLVLPGGTMNLLSKRLHGDLELPEILHCFLGGGARRVRPGIARCPEGSALAGLLAGPGTRWNVVREAMRDLDLAKATGGFADAMQETTEGPGARLAEPEIAANRPYPLIEITPGENGLSADGFHAEDAGDYIAQGWALLRRRFREGPHDRLGVFNRIVLESEDGSDLGLLIDGEPASLASPATITLAECRVDLLATGHAF
ncbi:diacylglycerol kinase family protein [Qipengyuania sp. JC766]|uniref:diacylglycerol/lipid kinase family protein n=1 Tax=Qipengyuania sp. JC766 TaxID=3232139 RepID=UPI00345775F6